jgi:ribonuclease HI
MDQKNVCLIWTDGACKGNPGRGGWGAYLNWNDHIHEIYGGEKYTTNNRMELMAVYEALSALKRPVKVQLHIDSQYVKNGLEKWLTGWKRNGWKTANGEAVKNQDLWIEIDKLLQKHQVSFKWVKGHAGIWENERADYLANLGVPLA